MVSPQRRTSAAPLQVVEGACRLSSNGMCASSPGFPRPYPLNFASEFRDADCAILVNKHGYITASTFHTVLNEDELDVAGRVYSGKSGPRGLYVNRTWKVRWWAGERSIGERSDQSYAGWKICWSSERTWELQTLSVARSYLQGSTDSLEGARHLQTVIISSNLLSCNAAKLTASHALGQGSFRDPR